MMKLLIIITLLFQPLKLGESARFHRSFNPCDASLISTNCPQKSELEKCLEGKSDYEKAFCNPQYIPPNKLRIFKTIEG